jgi:hypothetical protein
MAGEFTSGDVPIGVKIVSILSYILAVVGVIVGIMYIMAIFTNGDILVGLIGGLLFLFGGIFLIFVASHLWTGRKWARKGAITSYSVLSFLSLAVFATIFGKGPFASSDDRLLMVYSLIILIICLAVVAYLWFSKRVKELFF